MSHTPEDMLSRVELMADGDSGTWDLSPNDTEALAWVLKALSTARGDCQRKDAKLAEQAQEIERLNKLVSDIDEGFDKQCTAREKAERERDEALELCQREVANANKTTTAALLMGAQTNEALKEARKALVWLWDVNRDIKLAPFVAAQVRAAREDRDNAE